MQNFHQFDRHINNSVLIGYLARSMSMMLNCFYDVMCTVPVGAGTGKSFKHLVDNIYLSAD